MTEERHESNTAVEEAPKISTSSTRSSENGNNGDAKEAEEPGDGTQGRRDASKTPQEAHDPEKADSPLDQHHPALSKDIYSVFTVPQKRAIILTGSFIAWFSPMTGSIYFPALNQIARDLSISSAKVNITVTTYLVSNLSSHPKAYTVTDAGCRLSKVSRR